MKDRHGNPVPFTRMIDIPPVWLLGALALAALLHRLVPVGVFAGRWADLLGLISIAAGLGLIGWSALVFFRAKTPIHPRRKPRSLLTGGPFSLSRNPIYLAMVLIVLGFALSLGSVLPLLCAPLFGWIVAKRFIAGEEHFIEREFGDEWRGYAEKVRRWI